MSIDLEDWYHVENLRKACPHSTWDRCESRVAANVEAMLGMLGEQGVTATWFVLGHVARREPGLIRQVAAAGHEIACHGDNHQMVHQLTPAAFRQDVVDSRALLQDLVGQPIRGYRAPCFSITDWAVDVLAEVGFAYDASVFPVGGHDRYGTLPGVDGSQPVVMLRPGFYEVCTGVLPVRGRRLPWGGGGWFRLLPYPVFAAGVRRIRTTGRPYVFYLHPWEVDPGQPRARGLSPLARWRHYHHLARTAPRWHRLLAEFPWTTMGQLLQQVVGRRRLTATAA